jgi:hypothetical protein
VSFTTSRKSFAEEPELTDSARRGTERRTKRKPEQPKPVPLQARWPREGVKTIKVAAAEAEQTISEFLRWRWELIWPSLP